MRFSLKELMKLEEERLAEQARDREARELAAREAKAEWERRQQLELEARERARAEEEAERHRADNEDLARREAMQKAIVEQARVEVEVRERAAERDRERAHELELQRLKMASSSSSSRMTGTIASGIVGALAVGALALGLHFGITKPSNERQIAALTQTLASADHRADDGDRRAADQRRTIEGLEKSSHDQSAELESLKKDLAAAKRGNTKPVPNHGGKPGPFAHADQKEEDCSWKDPMCFKIPPASAQR